MRVAEARPDLPIFCLVDADPYGASIFSTYLAALASTQWIGLALSQLSPHALGKATQPLTPRDRAQLRRLQAASWPAHCAALVDELALAQQLGLKAELEAVPDLADLVAAVLCFFLARP